MKQRGLYKPFFIFKIAFLVYVISFSFSAFSQTFHTRIEADYSVKEILGDSNQSINLGKVFFDLNQKTLIYSQKFPEVQLIVFRDTAIYRIKGEEVFAIHASSLTIDFSIYNLILSEGLGDFGLKKLDYEVVDLKESGDKIISKWAHPKTGNAYVVISEANDKVDGVVLYDGKDNVVLKQFFRDYIKVGRLYFPSKIYELVEGKERVYKKMTSHSNVKINDFSDEDQYYNVFDNVIVDHIRKGTITRLQ
jgi:hypothetical protein